MPVTKPSTTPRWSETAGGSQSNIIDPASSQKDTGWPNGQKPPAKWFNWWMNLVYRWILYLQDLEAQTFTWIGDHVYTRSVTVSSAGQSIEAIGATGDAEFPGVKGTGGEASGFGVEGYGGADNGSGVYGAGTGTGTGVVGLGGSSGGLAFGVSGVGGSGGAAGVKGTGGGAGAVGVLGVGTSNNEGVKGLGNGGAPGVTGLGGGADGTGGQFTGGASNGNGVTGTGDGVGTGVVGTGGSSGIGVYGSGNGGAPGVVAASGHLQCSGTQPAKTASPVYNNILCGTNIPKAWGLLTTNGIGGATNADGYNVATVTVAGNVFIVTFALAMANANYHIEMDQGAFNASFNLWHFVPANKTTSGFQISVHSLGTTAGLAYGVVDLDTDICTVGFTVYGRQ